MADTIPELDFQEQETKKLSHTEILAMMKHDLESGKRIRALTDNERIIYGNAALNVSNKLPAFTSAVAILHPFVDATAETCYVDRHGRVGLSYFFLYAINWETRATWLIHEAMHVMNNHFIRADKANINPLAEMNICGDLEINTTLSTLRWTVMDNLLLPEKEGYDKYKTLEYYFKLRAQEKDNDKENAVPGAGTGDMSEDSQESGDSSGDEQGEGKESGDSQGSGEGQGNGDAQDGQGSGSGNEESSDNSSGSPKSPEQDIQDRLERDMKKGEKGPGGRYSDPSQACDQSTESRGSEADAEGIERSSDSMQEIARQDTRARIQAELNNSRTRGRNSSNAELYERMLALMSPPKVDWRQIFRSAVSNAYAEKVMGQSESSYRRVNRRYTQGNIIFPGTVDIQPTAMIAVDTSGSMSKDDYQATLTEIQAITEKACRSRNGIPMFSVDTTLHDVKMCRSVKELDLKGGGGTDMALPFKYASELPVKKQPDIFILATDGFVFWAEVEEALRNKGKYIAIILVTRAEMSSVPPSIHQYAKVIPIGEENS